jgi:spermidine synthase
VTVSGACVLAIEILGTRILGPFYGVSLFLWSALISVTLIALSIGYALGGRWADRGATFRRLAALLGGAGVWMLLVPWIRYPVLGVVETMGLRLAVLSAALILFAPPLVLLGMVAPYAIKLKTAALSEVGRSAGNLYAVSTVASVAAALATGFFLIPRFGVIRLTAAIGVLLLVTGAVMAARDRGGRVVFVVPFVFLLGGATAVRFQRGSTAVPEQGLLAVEQSPYGEIRVVDWQGIRYLLIDGGVHTEVDPATLRTNAAYANVIDIAGYYFGRPGDLLLVGLGGGSIAKRYAEAGWSVDVVEIDPAVTRLAYRFFGLDSADANVSHMDGRRYFISFDKKYDIIVMDAYGSSSIPFHLITREAFATIARRLNDGGLLVLNIISLGWHDGLVHAVGATLRTRFSHVIALPIAEPPNKLGNVILLASDRSLELEEEPPVPDWRFSADYDRFHAWENRFEPGSRGAAVLTDDLNPVDIWGERINLEMRRDLCEHFGTEGLAW